MMKYACLLMLVFSIACKKDKENAPSDIIPITYEVQSDIGGLQVTYTTYNESTKVMEELNWSVASAGTSTKAAAVRKGLLAVITAKSQSDGHWILYIKDSSDHIVSTNTPITRSDGPPVTYSSTASWEGE